MDPKIVVASSETGLALKNAPLWLMPENAWVISLPAERMQAGKPDTIIENVIIRHW